MSPPLVVAPGLPVALEPLVEFEPLEVFDPPLSPLPPALQYKLPTAMRLRSAAPG
jgi:hypothetical protein